MKNLTKDQAEKIARGLKFYAKHFEGYEIQWDKFEFKNSDLLFYCTDKDETEFRFLIPNSIYYPIYVKATKKGDSESTYFGGRIEELLEYVNQ
jgi:hypothetical protein